MSDIEHEPMPTGVGVPVVPYVIQDLRDKQAFGIGKYGGPLATENGRDPLRDLYQELLDGVQYLKQHFMEGRSESELPILVDDSAALLRERDTALLQLRENREALALALDALTYIAAGEPAGLLHFVHGLGSTVQPTSTYTPEEANKPEGYPNPVDISAPTTARLVRYSSRLSLLSQVARIVKDRISGNSRLYN